MNKIYELTIIGGGILGCLTALIFKNKFPNSSILLIDKGEIGDSGATSVSRGIIRAFDFEEKLIQSNIEGIMYYKKKFDSKFISLTGMYYRVPKTHYEYAKKISNEYSTEEYPIYLKKFCELNLEMVGWFSDDDIIYEPHGGYGDPSLICHYIKSILKDEKNLTILENSEVKYINNGYVYTNELKFHTKKIVVSVGANINHFYKDDDVFFKEISVGKLNHNSLGTNSSIIDGIENSYFRPEGYNKVTSGSKLNSIYTIPVDIPSISTDIQLSDSLERAELCFKKTKFELDINQNKTRALDCYSVNSVPIIKCINNIIFAYGLSGVGFKSAPSIANKIIKLME